MKRMHKERMQQEMDETLPERREPSQRGVNQRQGKGRMMDRIPPQMRERINNLPPEERQRVLKRLRDRIEKGEFDQKPQPKPRPEMKDVDIFSPDDGDN